MRKTTQGTLADLLATLQAGSAHLTLRLLSSSEGVHLSWGVQEPDPALQAPSEAPLCPSPPPVAVKETLGELHCPRPAHSLVSKALGRALSYSSDALAGAGTVPGAGSTAPLLEDKPLEDAYVMDVPQEDMPLGTEGEALLPGHDTAFPAAPGTEAQVPPGFLQGGVASLSTKDRSTGQCRPKGPEGSELEAREGDIDFLGRRIPFLREEEMRALDGGSFLDSGGNGCARLLLWDGAPVVRKEFHHDGALLSMMREALLMLELRGAGGVPRPLALGFQPLTIIQEFVGVLRFLGQLCRRLWEVHTQGVVHNDLKADNIIVSGGVHRPVLHVIDLGWACRAGRVAGDFSIKTGEEDDFPREGLGAECRWMEPEVRAWRPVFASGDVFILGFLLQQIANYCIQPWLAVPLWRLGQRCAREEPSSRPCLPKVARAMAALR
ncbi:hypothetical protein E2C01_060872 [Portunus trituberculatus]|uniref:Protein kinase domain-containing protein n=1 Tax=Portunus trituberculatus TaxID=210409 RepID=A0A5B7H2D0_PORTR|nr:hypothetical protein [Portunus trituberculatus]